MQDQFTVDTMPVRIGADTAAILATRYGVPFWATFVLGGVVAGLMGSDRFMEFTVIGDPVNIAARVEALTRVHQVDILVTEEVMKTLDPRFVARPMPPVAVKGKTEPIATFAIESYGAATQSSRPARG